MAGRLTVRHLELFSAVCACGGVSAAARELGVSQPSVSQAVRDLEERFGTTLFDRVSRRMDVTEAGRRLLDHAREVLDDLEELERAMGEGGVSVLRLASSITCGTCHLPRLLSALREREGGVKVRVRVEDSGSVERDVLANDVDLGLVEGLVHSDEIVAVPFAREELVVVGPPGRTGGRLGVRDLVREPLVLRERGSGVRELLEAALTAHGLAVDPVWESVSTEAIRSAVEAGLGLSVLPADLVARDVAEGRLARIEVDGLELARDLLVIRHRRKAVSPAMAALLALMPPGRRPGTERAPLAEA